MALRISDPVNLKWKTKNEYNWGRLRLQRLLCFCSVEKYDTVMATLQTWNKPATFRKFVLEIITIASAVCSKKISESTASSHGPLKILAREKSYFTAQFCSAPFKFVRYLLVFTEGNFLFCFSFFWRVKIFFLYYAFTVSNRDFFCRLINFPASNLRFGFVALFPS